LKNEYSNDYDIVVRLRFDILFFNKIDFNQIKAKLGKKLVIDNEYGGNKKL
jgi:hypothetical protein